MADGRSEPWFLAQHLIFLCSLQDTTDLLTGSAGGYVSGQIYYDAFLARFGHGGGGIVAMGTALLSFMRSLLARLDS